MAKPYPPALHIAVKRIARATMQGDALAAKQCAGRQQASKALTAIVDREVTAWMGGMVPTARIRGGWSAP